MDVVIQNAGRAVGNCLVKLKPLYQYGFFFLMIAYECYDCVSDGMNVYQYYEGESSDVSPKNRAVYNIFLFSLVASVACAVSSAIGYLLMATGLSQSLWKHESERNNNYKLGKLIVFFSLFCEICFEQSIQSVVLYYYIVRCSAYFSFWKVSLFVCVTLSLLYAGFTFGKGAYRWSNKRAVLPRKYPSCFEPCYHAKACLFTFIFMCVIGTLLSLSMFALNIATLTDIIKAAEVDIPHIVAINEYDISPSQKILPVRDLVQNNGTAVKKIPCTADGNTQSHFMHQAESFNCSSVIFTLTLKGKSKKLEYKMQYCMKGNEKCESATYNNITVKFTHDLCATDSPYFVYLEDPAPSRGNKPTIAKERNATNSIEITTNHTTNQPP